MLRFCTTDEVFFEKYNMIIDDFIFINKFYFCFKLLAFKNIVSLTVEENTGFSLWPYFVLLFWGVRILGEY